jgi:hypothetical protein
VARHAPLRFEPCQHLTRSRGSSPNGTSPAAGARASTAAHAQPAPEPQTAPHPQPRARASTAPEASPRFAAGLVNTFWWVSGGYCLFNPTGGVGAPRVSARTRLAAGVAGTRAVSTRAWLQRALLATGSVGNRFGGQQVRWATGSVGNGFGGRRVEGTSVASYCICGPATQVMYEKLRREGAGQRDRPADGPGRSAVG